VFLVEPIARLDLSKALEWGELISLFQIDESRAAVWSRDYLPEVLRRLEATKFEPDDWDRILIAGPIINLVMVSTALVAAYPRIPIRALYFCGETRRYVERYLGLQCAQPQQDDKFTLGADAIEIIKHTSRS
jgi:hypothetical protein